MWGLTLPALFDPVLAMKFGGDFVQYYTQGWLALHGAGNVLYDPAALHAAQAALVPALAHLHFPAVYPPQAGPLFAPLALMPYSVASALWMSASALAYFFFISRTARHTRHLRSDRLLLWVAAISFPPFWYLILFRQNSIILLIAMGVGVRLLERGRPALAGFALGFLALKPQFGIPFAVLALYRRDVLLVVGAIGSVLLQGVMAVAVFGADVITNFVRNIPVVIASANHIEPFLYKSLSLRTVSRLLPSPIGEGLWAIVCILVLVAMVRVCRTQVPVRLYMAVVILASVLVNPHVYVYDGVVLALPFIWLGEWRLGRGEGRLYAYHALGFWLAAILMMPLTLALGSLAAVSVTVIAVVALGILFWTTVRDLRIDHCQAVPATFVPISA
jgi:hypothetical protein